MTANETITKNLVLDVTLINLTGPKAPAFFPLLLLRHLFALSFIVPYSTRLDLYPLSSRALWLISSHPPFTPPTLSQITPLTHLLLVNLLTHPQLLLLLHSFPLPYYSLLLSAQLLLWLLLRYSLRHYDYLFLKHSYLICLAASALKTNHHAKEAFFSRSIESRYFPHFTFLALTLNVLRT